MRTRYATWDRDAVRSDDSMLPTGSSRNAASFSSPVPRRMGSMFRKIQRIHLVGIGGAGMSGIAEVLLTLGFKITGSDLNESDSVSRLRELGGQVFIGHEASNIGD